MTILKLKAQGDSATFNVAKCEVVEGQYGEQVKFTAANGDQLFISRETADRQLSRCGFADGEAVLYSDVDGVTLCFSRDPNKKMPDKPYWGITRVTDMPVTHRAGNVKAAESLGPSIPGLDDDDYMKSLEGMDEDGMPPIKQPAPIVKLPNVTVNVPVTPEAQDKEAAYFNLARRVAAFQGELAMKHGCPMDLASINAMTFSLWKN